MRCSHRFSFFLSFFWSLLCMHFIHIHIRAMQCSAMIIVCAFDCCINWCHLLTQFLPLCIHGAYNVCIGKIYYYKFATQIALLNERRRRRGKKGNYIKYTILFGVALKKNCITVERKLIEPNVLENCMMTPSHKFIYTFQLETGVRFILYRSMHKCKCEVVKLQWIRIDKAEHLASVLSWLKNLQRYNLLKPA